jgi:hypothetical protein
MRIFTKGLKWLALVPTMMLMLNSASAQCTFYNKQENGTTYFPRIDNQTVGMGNAAFLRFQVKNTAQYHWDVCGFTGYDTRLTGYNAANTEVWTQDDFCAGVGGLNRSSSTTAFGEYTSNYDGEHKVQLNRYSCLDWGAGFGSATLNYRCIPPASPTQLTAGNGTWNIYCYDAGDAAGGNNAWVSSRYAGYYTDNTLNFNTGTRWVNTPYDANATGGQAYRGCYIPNDYHSWSAVRTNIACGGYQLQVQHDDIGQIFINGTNVYNNAACCASTNAGTYVIKNTDVITYRVSEGAGGSNGLITFNATAALGGGTIGGIANPTTICNGSDPGAFTNTANPTGGASAAITYGTNTFQWEQAPTVGFASITNVGTNSATYDPPALTTGTYFFRRKVTDACGNVAYSNVIQVNVNAAPTTALAGPDQTGASTCGLTSVTLAANTPSVGTGAWSIISGAGGTVTTPSSPTSTFSGTAGTAYTLRWTISNSPCSASTDDVNVTFNRNPTTANAGPDQTSSATCGLTSVTLAGNAPSVGTGAWSIISGAGGTVTTPSSATSTFSGTAGTTYTLRWTISNSPCTASTDDVVITFNRNPTTANAGPDQTSSATCGLTSVTLAGNAPSVGTGAWSIISGAGGTVTTPSSATSTFSGTAGTTYTLRWTISNSPCTASTDDVVITFNRNPTTANAGPDQTSSATCGLTSVTLAGNAPSVGTGAWSIISGAGGTVTTPSSATSTFSGTAGTTYTLRWTISNSPCTASTDDVVITFNRNPTTANAGPDQTSSATCGLTTVTLAGNAPSVGTGAWSIISGAGGTVTTPTSATSTFSGTAGTTYTLRWTISNSPCTASTDDVVITFNQNPTTANAGPDQTSSATCGLTSVTLAGNAPSVGTGAWSIISGAGGTVTTPSSATSTFSGTAGTTYTLRWTISNSPCTASTDDVVITFNQNPTTANAGPDQTSSATCGLTSVTLAGNAPSIGTGVWSIISGAGGTVTTPTSATSTFSGTAGTTYTLRWTISNSPCTASTDDVVITFNQNPTTANAGPDQTSSATCGLTSVTLAGNAPSIGTGAWSIISGAGGTVTTPTSETSTFSGTAGTTYTLRWTISNSPCTASTDDVVITFNQNPTTANAGPDQTSSATCGLTSVTLAGNAPSVGTGAWSIISGAGGTVTTPSSATSTFSGTAGTTYTLRWTISNTPCIASTDDIVVTFNQNPTASNAGGPQTICETGAAILAANSPSVGTGAWTVVSGPSTSTSQFSSTSSNTATFTPAGGAGSYLLRWTISNAPCTSSTSDVTITVDAAPTTAAAGTDQTNCNNSSFTLAGNNPSIGTGAWTVVSGTASITTPAANNSGVTGVTLGTSATLRWTISNGVCTASTDDVVLTNANAASVPTSGGDQEACYRASVPNLTVTVGGGETADWYDAASGGTLVKTGSLTFNEATDGSGPNPLPGTYTYYAEGRNTTSGCISATRVAVTLTIRAVPVISPTATPNTACSGDNVLLDANATAGAGTITSYAWSSGLGAVASGTVNPTTTTIYTVTVQNSYSCTNDASTTVTVKSAAALVVLPTSSVTTLVEQCTDGGWTYYAKASSPDDWTFAIRKNGNTFTAQVDVTVAGSTIDHINTTKTGYEHGSYLMKRYWDVNVLSWFYFYISRCEVLL